MSDEWYTLPKYVEAARQALGEIDLDPASCEEANKTVKAKLFYTKEQNGLLQHWTGRIWMNPPYGRTANQQGKGLSTIRLFTDKLVQSYEGGEVSAAIVLATAEINAKWFQPLWAYPICIPNHRVNFMVSNIPKSRKYSQMFGTVFVYLGPDEQKFAEVFCRFGHIIKRFRAPAQEVALPELWSEAS
jgi:hypothetical protein